MDETRTAGPEGQTGFLTRPAAMPSILGSAVLESRMLLAVTRRSLALLLTRG